MTSFCLSTPTLSSTSKTLLMPYPTSSYSSSSSSLSSSSASDNIGRLSCRCSLVPMSLFGLGRNETTRIHYSNRRAQKQVICMAPDEEKLTRRNPLDFPVEWERPKPGRRPDIFPQFSPMKTPLPPPMPYDPPEEDEEEEEEKKEEEEEDPDKEEPDNPEKQ